VELNETHCANVDGDDRNATRRQRSRCAEQGAEREDSVGPASESTHGSH
jgi:hypothetical protein